MFQRRSFIGAAAAFAAAGLGGPRAARPAVAEPLLIGCISALSGPQEVLGRPILAGAQIAADQINDAGGVLGRPLEIVGGDAHADPVRAVQIAREMSRRGVNLLCGCVTSDLALAVAAELPSLDAVLITCSAQTDKLTHEAFVPNCFRVTDQTYMRNRAQARLMAARHPDVARWGAILPDSEYGRSSWAAFRDGLIEANGQAAIDEPVWAKFGATDFQPQIAALRRNGADGLFVAVYGEDGILFYEQAIQAGGFGGVKAVADSFNEFQAPLAFGGSIPSEVWLAMSWYYGGYEGLPLSRALYEENMRRTGNAMPSGLLCSGHSAVRAYAAAIAKAGSAGTGAVIAGLSGLTVETAKGPVTFRPEDHQAVCDVNFVRIKSSSPGPNLDMVDFARPDIEVAEFVRYAGADVIEPPSPGRPLAHHA